MKKPRIIDAVGYIDDAMIQEAVIYKPAKNKIPAWTKWAISAACICICVACVFAAQHSGMGQTVFYHPISMGERVYYSDSKKNTYYWEPSMDAPKSLEIKGRFIDTEEGPVLYSSKEQLLFLANEQGLTSLGKTHISEFLEDPALIGLYGKDAYWVGKPLNMSENCNDTEIIRTSLSNGTAERLLTFKDEEILSYAIKEGCLYYQVTNKSKAVDELRVWDIVSHKDTLRMELSVNKTSGMAPQSCFMKDYIVIVDRDCHSLWKMSYGEEEAELLAEVVPYNNAIAEKDGKMYFGTSFDENESHEAFNASDLHREEFVSVDLENGELDYDLNFELNNENGTVRYTILELAMAKDGFYFTEPQKGLYYHSSIDGTDTLIH